MAGVWSASFVFALFVCFARSQPIYRNENNECVRNEKTMLILKDQINFLTQENARQIDSLRQENARKIDSLTKENARLIDSLRQENAKIKNQLVSILKRNMSDTEEDLSLLKIIANGLNAKDCNDLYINGITKSGVYEIYPSGVYKINPSGVESKISVFCDMMVEGGGWTAIQKRVSGSVDFNRTWAEYKTGFGSPNDAYWIGNDVIHQLTKGRNSSLYVSITLRNGTKFYELYNQFSVADETNKYELFLGGPAIGTLGDSMVDSGSSSENQAGMEFSTPDRDHDRDPGNCAAYWGGSWWFNKCHRAFLNGRWYPGYWINPWYTILRNGREITETVMMIKPH